MRSFLIIFLIIYTISCSGQEKIKGYIGLSQMVNYKITNTETSLDFGIQFSPLKSDISIFGSYAYGGVINYSNFENYHKDFSAFQLDYHLLGGGIKIRFRSKDKLYRPSIKATVLTEIASKYRGNKLIIPINNSQTIFTPTNWIYPQYQLSYENYGEDKLLYYQTYNYISTPIMGSFFFGNEFRIFEGLYVNVELGYLFRAVRFYHKKWLPDAQEPKTKIVETHRLKDSPNGKTVFQHYFEFGIGINYTFPFHKEKQLE